MQCEILHSKKTDKQNKQTLKDFLDETKQKQIIISVDMISEGLDVPNCDSILFLYN